MKIFKWFVALWVTLALVACGGGGGNAGAPAGGDGSPATGPVPASVEVLTSSATLQSSGESVEITAFVKSSGNVAIANQAVNFSATSGLLQNVSATTDENGVATAKLAAGSDKSNRVIAVKVAAGNVSGQVDVSVKGIQLTLAGELALKLGLSADYTIKVVDGAGQSVPGAKVTLSSELNNVFRFSGVPTREVTTGPAGTVTVTYTANTTGQDIIEAKSLGASARQLVTVSAVDVAFKPPVPPASTQIPVGSTATFTVQYSGLNPAIRSVAFSTTRGQVVSADAKTGASGDANVTVKSDSAGPATVVAVIYNADATVAAQASIAVDFIAQTPSTIVMQSSLGAIPPNSAGSDSSQSTIEATVRDAAGNLVAGKAVNFNIVRDFSGGKLSTATVNTDQYGKARVQYVAGTSSTGADGVVISGTVAGTIISSNVKLTVNAEALFINIAYGNTMSNLDQTMYSKPFSVYVTDATGNPVGNQQVTISVIPSGYMKGWLVNQNATGTVKYDSWRYSAESPTKTCPNTDSNLNGILDASEGVLLRPGNVVAATPGVLTTDSSGRATFALQYGEQFAWWVNVNLTANAQVTGTESRTTQTFMLDMLSDDANDVEISPANRISPFGIDSTCP